MARYIASELGYPQSAARLTEKLQDFSVDEHELKTLMFDCVRWVSLNLAEEALVGPFNAWQRQRDPHVHDCLDALHNAVLVNKMPADLILVYSSLTMWTQMYAYVKEAMVSWKDLGKLENIITHHNSFCETQGEVLERLLDLNVKDNDTMQAISHEMASQRHLSQTLVTGCALFFAVMCGAYAQTRIAAIQHEQAVEIGDNIIKQLRAHDEQDPTRPSHRKFLETFGRSRSDELEKVLSNFITAVDTLTINRVAHIGGTRDLCSSILYVCKDMVEGNAARLKGWGGLDDRVDVQMILFHECARRLESMSASAGTEEALAKGCILTATAKLIRSLHKILQGFKKTMMAAQRRSASESTKSNPTPPSAPSEMSMGSELAPAVTGSTEWDSLLNDDLFADWENWPQFDAFDFSDLFGNVFDFDESVGM